MPHDVSLIALIAAGYCLALLFGLLAARLRLPPIVGYLLAGIAVGPATPGFVGDMSLAGQLAEIGVMLLMFGVGLHFSLADLADVRRIAVPGAIVQIGVAVVLGAAAATLWGWPLPAALVFGLCLSCASTVVLLRALEARDLLESVNGRIAVGWLVVEDLVMVLVLVLLPAFAGMATAGVEPAALAITFGVTLAKIGGFIAIMLIIGKRALPKILWWVARTGSRELFTLCVVAAAVGVAFGAAKLFDVSFALGAFFAGMMLRESEFSHRAADETLPLRDAFAVLFFVSVGMLFDPATVWEDPLRLVIVVGIVVIGKTLAAMALVLAFRYPLGTALTVGAALAQIGEFSFILAGLGVALDMLPEAGQDLVLAAALVSIALNAALFTALGPVQQWLRERLPSNAWFERRTDPFAQLPANTDESLLTGHVLLVGYGRVGRRIGDALEADGIPFVTAEGNRELVERLRARGLPAVSGDVATADVLIQAHVARAAMLVVAIPDTVDVRRLVSIARTLNPAIEVVIRSHNDTEAELLRQDTGGTVFLGEEELARGMIAHVRRRRGTRRTTHPATAAG
ncbi:MAG: Kef family K(+) transporter [Gammaproteobacteria bacterium]|nr:Kef family K(+) transporter [Gammaproteobacteria bacterium]